MKKFVFFVVLFAVAACSTMGPVHVKRHSPVERERKYLVFPFTNPVNNAGKEIKGIGERLTVEFAAACAEQGLSISVVNDDRFSSSDIVDEKEAVEYAMERDAAYAITGLVTRWVDYYDNYDSGMSDAAGFKISARGVYSRKVAFSAEVRAKSGTFWRGTPDLFLKELAKEMAKVFLEE